MREQFVNNKSLAKSEGVGSKNWALGQWQRRVCWTSTCCSFSIIHWEPRSHSTKQHVFLFPFFFVLFFFFLCGYLGSFEVLVLLNFSFDPCLVAEKWRGNRRNMKVWIFSIVFLFWGFGIIWHEHSAESGKMSNLIFLYYFCAESELYICIFSGYKLGFTFSLRLISVQFVI